MARLHILMFLVFLGINLVLPATASGEPISTELNYYEGNTLLFSKNETRIGSYVDLGSYPHWCLSDVMGCTSGLSTSFMFKSKPTVATKKREIIFTNGGHVANGEGIYMAKEYGYQYSITVNVGVETWNIPFNLSPDLWYNIAVSWSISDGLKVFIDGLEIAAVPTSDAREFSDSDYEDSKDVEIGLDEFGFPETVAENFYIKDVIFYDNVSKIDELTKTLDEEVRFGCSATYTPADTTTDVSAETYPIYACRKHCQDETTVMALLQNVATCSCTNEEAVSSSSDPCTPGNWIGYIITRPEPVNEVTMNVWYEKISSRAYIMPGEDVKIYANLSVNLDVTYEFLIDSNTIFTSQLPINYHWDSPGSHSVIVKTSFGTVELQDSIVIPVEVVDEGVAPKFVDCEIGHMNQSRYIFYNIYTADDYNRSCMLYYGDDNSKDHDVTTVPFKKLLDVKIYLYPGQYNVTLVCNNTYGSTSSSKMILAREFAIKSVYLNQAKNYSIKVYGDDDFKTGLDVKINSSTANFELKSDGIILYGPEMIPGSDNLLTVDSGVVPITSTIIRVEKYLQYPEIISNTTKGSWAMNIEFTFVIPPGDHILVTIDYGIDEDSIEYQYVLEAKTTQYINTTKAFSGLGQYRIVLTVSNDVSSLSTYKDLTVEIPITTIDIAASNVTSLATPVQLNVDLNAGNKGPIDVHFEIDYDDGNTDTIVYHNTDTLAFAIFQHSYSYTNWGIYNIQVRAFNNISSVTGNIILQVGQNITFLDVTTEMERISTGNDVTFSITCPTGSDITYNMNFGDGTTFSLQESSTNPTSNGHTTAQIDESTVTMVHTYTTPGYFNANVTASNTFGTATSTLCPTVVVDTEPNPVCSVQNVLFKGMNSSLSSPYEVKRSEETLITIDEDMQCPINATANYSWKATKLSLIGGTQTEETVHEICLFQERNNTLTIPALALSYGLYKITVTVAPEGFDLNSYSKILYLKVVMSDPVAVIEGGEVQSFLVYATAIFDISESRDPDLRYDWRRGVSYDMFCMPEFKLAENENKMFQELKAEADFVGNKTMFRTATKNPISFHQIGTCFNDTASLMEDLAVFNGKITFAANHFTDYFSFGFILYVSRGNLYDSFKQIVEVRKSNASLDDLSSLLDIALTADPDTAIRLLDGAASSILNAAPTSVEDQEKLASSTEAVVGTLGSVAKRVDNSNQATKCAKTFGTMTSNKDLVNEESRSKAAEGLGDLANGTANMEDATVDDASGFAAACLGGFDNIFPTKVVEKAKRTRNSAETKVRRSVGSLPDIIEMTTMGSATTLPPLEFTTSHFLEEDQAPAENEEEYEYSMAPCDVATRLLNKLPELNTYDELLYFICDDCALFRKVMKTITVESTCPCVSIDQINKMQCNGDFTDQDKIFALMTYLEHPGDLYQYYVKPLLEAKRQRDEARRLTDGKVSKSGSDALMTVAGTINGKASDDDREERSFESSRLGMKVQKVGNSKNGTANDTKKQSMAMPTGAFNLPMSVLSGAANCENVNTMFLGDKDNPYTYSKEKANVGKGVLTLGYSCGNEKVTVQDTKEPIELWMNRESEAYDPGTFVLLTRWGDSAVTFNYHPLNITDKNTSLQVVLKPFAPNEAFDVYVSFGIRPNETHYDHMETVPKTDISYLGEIEDEREKEELMNTVTVPLNKTSSNGTYWIGVKLQRGTVSLTGELTNHTYSLLNLVSGCRYWDEEEERWSSKGCKVGELTTKYRTQCFCNHLTSFGSDFVVPVNTIDFTNVWAKFNNLSENAAVFSTIITILGIYLLSLIWARYMDKKDLLKWGALPLSDNLPTDNYHYQMTIQTGMRKNAGTESKISFILSGDDADTGVRRLWDEKRKRIPRGTIFNYVLSVEGPLGPPSFLRIWHDNSGPGKSKSWYLDQVQLTDLQTGEKFFFLCDRWLAVEEDDGMVDRIIPVAGINDLIAFKQLFSSSARKKLANEHLWVSVFSRPTRSNFTRVQRISCCMALLFLTMITNCMFFKAEDNVQHVTALTLGPFQFTLQQVYISVVSTLIVFPVSFLLVTFFRRCRPKKNAIMQTHQQVKRNKFKWKNVNQSHQTALWGPQVKKTRMAKLKESLTNILSVHQKSKYETGQTKLNANKPEKKKRKKEPFTLPHWCLYIGWALCFLSIVGSAFFTILYSMEWGATKATDWLITFCMSFFQSVIIIQPIKVLLIVAFLACILKKPDLDEEEVHEDFDTIIQHDEEAEAKKKDVDITALMMQRKLANSDYRPPDLSELEETRQLRLNEIKMEAVVKDILVYAFFVLIIFFLSYQQRDSESFLFTENLKNRFSSSFENVQTIPDYWKWLDEQFLPNFYASQYFNSTTIVNWQDRNCISDLDTRRVGVARIRQMRIKEDSCELRGVMKDFINHCRSDYGWIADDTSDYFTRWVTPVGINTSLLEDATTPWVYQNSVQLKNAPYVANIATYKGGGYVALTKRQLCRTRKVVETLKKQDWLDLRTRAVFLEFTVYNPNSNLFGSAVLVAEFTALGRAFTRTEFKVFRLLSYIGAWGVVVVLFEVIYACFTLFFFIQCIKKVKLNKMKYFKDFWSLLEFVLLTFAVTVIAMYAFKHILTNLAFDALFDRESDGFVNFQSVALYDETYGYMMSFVVFLATIQFLKLLQFNQKMSMLGDTIRVATKDLKVFSISFLLYFFTFTATAYLLFGPAMATYNSLIGAAESMFAFALGSFDFERMADTQRILGPIFFFMFIGVVYIGLMSIFLTIIGEAFTRVKEDVTLRRNEYEIVDFMWKRFKALLGLN